MKTIQDALLNFNQALKPVYDQPEIDSIKYLAISDVTGLSKTQLRAFTDNKLSALQADKLTEITQRLKTGEPLQYILGHTEFYGLSFNVNPSVLIPRPETEELVEWVLTEVRERKAENGEQILDIGTGSGCIPITLKKHLPNAEVSAIDISDKALNTSRQNAKLNAVEVNFIKQDILKPTHNSQLTTHYSILISNPPYVTEREKAGMHTNVLAHEPHLALFVTNEDPLIFYRAVADFALTNLVNNGLLFFEINENLGSETVQLLQDKGFKNIELRHDMRGKDRMIKATR